jgi:serine phosphatase RsbU (regulator of sigma subunit)/anti-sigma regulatory factor (Ser/Thr protein kinase)
MPDIHGASRPALLRFALPCDLNQVRRAGQTVHSFLMEQGCGEEILSACDLAFVEACNNAIKYAPASARACPVGVEIACSIDQLELRVTDHTPGFDWPERAELPSPESESGRGIFLIQSLMDSAHYLRGKSENILVLRKSRPSASGKNGSPSGIRIEHDHLTTGLLEELSSCYESLSAIFRYSTEPGHSRDMKKFAHRLLSDLAAVVGAEWFVFRNVQNKSHIDVLAASESGLDAGSIIFRGDNRDGAFVEAEAAISRRPIWFDENRALAAADPLRLKPRSRGMVYPVFVGDDLVGTLTMGRSVKSIADGQRVFNTSQENAIAAFAQFLAIQIVNAQAQEEVATNRITARELEIAGTIQRSLLLKELPQLPKFELAALCRSAHRVGGDFFDILRLSEDTALLVIADVMGKGVLAAMFAAVFRAVLRATPELNREPAALLARVNQLLFDELSNVDMFITAQLAFVDVKARKLIVGSAGHCPLLVADSSGVKSLSPEGMPLGILADAVFANETVDLPEHCRVLLYTDGLTEAMNAAGERFGQERLAEWLPQARGRSASELQDELADALARFQTKTSLNDDQTFLIMTG